MAIASKASVPGGPTGGMFENVDVATGSNVLTAMILVHVAVPPSQGFCPRWREIWAEPVLLFSVRRI